MTAQTVLVALSAPAQLRRSAVMTWLELPRVVVVGLAWIVLALPLLSALLGAPWWLVAIAALPTCVYATGMVRFAAIIARGDRPSIRDAFRVDAILGFTVWVGVFVASALLAGGRPLLIAGVLLVALLLLVVPFVLAYGAIRGRSGFSAWRGGLILVAFRPGTALTVLGLNIIGAFVVVASLGVLGVFVPVFLFAFTCAIVAAQLDEIDSRTGQR